MIGRKDGVIVASNEQLMKAHKDHFSYQKYK